MKNHSPDNKDKIYGTKFAMGNCYDKPKMISIVKTSNFQISVFG